MSKGAIRKFRKLTFGINRRGCVDELREKLAAGFRNNRFLKETRILQTIWRKKYNYLRLLLNSRLLPKFYSILLTRILFSSDDVVCFDQIMDGIFIWTLGG